jgi:hypothetical protein
MVSLGSYPILWAWTRSFSFSPSGNGPVYTFHASGSSPVSDFYIRSMRPLYHLKGLSLYLELITGLLVPGGMIRTIPHPADHFSLRNKSHIPIFFLPIFKFLYVIQQVSQHIPDNRPGCSVHEDHYTRSYSSSSGFDCANHSS